MHLTPYTDLDGRILFSGFKFIKHQHIVHTVQDYRNTTETDSPIQKYLQLYYLKFLPEY